MTPAGRQRIEALAHELDEKAKAQLAVVTVRSLQGRPLEEFTVDLATKWGVGPKGSDRGVLLFLAIEDREGRIEVGYGIEPVITDGRAGSILRSMVPYLQRGDYDGALWLGSTSLAQPIAQEAGVTLAALAAAPAAPPAPRWEDQVLGEWLPIILWVTFAILFFGPLALMLLPKRWRKKMGGFGTWADRQPGSRGGWHGSGWSGGGGGGGFGGFGGGSFGGGGASGKW
jgi:uncharacterized protein